METRGRFITFEGGEGSGKSTQLRALARRLEIAGTPYIETREPGGSEGAEKIRALIVRGKTCDWDALSEYFLLSAARRDHIVRTIVPALEKGTWVLCDRYMDSSRVYQGLRGLDTDFMEDVYAHLSGGLVPDLTFILDMDPRAGLARAMARGDAEDRFEKMGSAFHTQVREAFLALGKAFPGRCVVMDASKDKEALSQDIWGEVQRRLMGESHTPCPNTPA